MRPEHIGLIRTPSRPSVYPDGTWAVVAITRTELDTDTYPSQLWRIELADGSLRPLTHGFRDTEPVISPDGRHIAFIRAAKGGKPQLAVMATDGGEPQVLTDHDLGVSARPQFSPDSTRIAYTARIPEQGRYGTAKDVGPDAEPPRHITTFTYRLDGPGFFTDRPQHVFVVDIPAVPDPVDDAPGKVADEDAPAKTAGDAKTADSGEPEAAQKSPGARDGVSITPVQVSTGKREHHSPVWTPDGQYLLMIRSVPDALRTELLRFPADGGDGQVVDTPGSAPGAIRFDQAGSCWLLERDLGEDDLDFIGKSPGLFRARFDGGTLVDAERVVDPVVETINQAVFEVDAAGVLLSRSHRGDVDLVRFTGDSLQPVFSGTVSVVGADLLPGGAGVLVATSTVDSAGDLWLVDGEGSPRRLTDLSRRLRAETDLVAPQELQVDSDDGYPVHGWVTIPAGDGPHPVLLLIHGGPYAQYEGAFFDEVQVYTNAGYAVVFCNPRGSAGYGQEHGRSISGAFGDRDAADVLAFLDGALAANPSLDADRVGVLGGSYGGYMTAWLTTRTDRFVAAIVERGFLDPVSFEGSSDIGWYFGLRYLGEDPEQVAAQSPMAHIDKVNTPTFVIHSEHDWRCPVEQGQRWYVGLKRRGVQAELLLFPGEGHELSRSGLPKHRLARFEHILDWWQRHLPVTTD